jgi:hypothetical protein
MKHAAHIGRLGMLAVGLGIGVAVATPAVASADSSTAPFSLIDQLLGGVSVPAANTQGLDMQISIDGTDLLPTTDNTATAVSGPGDIAIAIGNDSAANAGGLGTGGLFDFALAHGTDSGASAGVGNFDFASANGDDSRAISGGGNFDTALANGTDSDTLAGGIINNGTLFPGSDDLGFAWGPHTFASSGIAFTGTDAGNSDIAAVLDPFGTVGSTAYAGDGNFDLGAVLFADGLTANAFPGDDLISILPML